MLTASDISIFERIVDVEDHPLDPAAARGILTLNFAEHDHARMQTLAEKANEGLLTADERREYESYVRMGDLLSILHSKAHLALQRHGIDS
jgi:hypothetical protein